LKVLEGKNPGMQYELGVKALTLGRHNTSTIQIIDEAASNYHAEINREPIGYVLTDLGSTNGTRVKHKNKSDFEKVIKTPLSEGMQIRVGKTLLEFQNIGKPVEDEANFGTIALDTDKLQQKLQMPRRGLSKGLVAMLALIVFVGVIAIIVYMVPPPPPPGPPPEKIPVVNTSNRFVNGDFEQGTDDDGNPKSFRVERGVPGIKIAVLPEADTPPEKDHRKRLQISKTGARSTSTIVEMADTFAVEPAKVYEFTGSMRNDGDGLFGLRVTWIQGERQFSEHPIVLRDSQEWKTKSVTLSPPAWAARARAGVFVQGKDGAAYFDSLCFTEKPGVPPLPYPRVKFGGMEVGFEGTKGSFVADSMGERVIEDGTLQLVSPDGRSESELCSAMNQQFAADANKVTYSGKLYDFALQDSTNYTVKAQPGAAGVELGAAMDIPHENGSQPRLRFYVVGPAGSGGIEVSKGPGVPEKVSANEDKTLKGITGLLFNPGKTPQLDVAFAKAADVELKREGNRRRVTVKFQGELQLALSPESLGQKQEMVAAIAALDKAVQDGKWGDVEARTKKMNEVLAAKFPQAQDAANKAQQKLQDAWAGVADDIDRSLRALQLAITAENIEAVKNKVMQYALVWAGSSKEQALKGYLDNISAIENKGKDQAAEAKAQRYIGMVEKFMAEKQYDAANSYLNAILKDDAMKATKTAEKAKELLPAVEKAKQRQDELDGIEKALRQLTEAHRAAKDWTRAIQTIEKHPDYQKNAKDLPEIQKLLEELRKKERAAQ
jgi:pSer/pThr/pTyr-binding forkhead associated (FHA) protein